MAPRHRQSAFYDLAKNAVIRLAFAQSKELTQHGGTAVALTPGWMRSEMMLDAFGVTEDTWREALERQPHFEISESPRFAGRPGGRRARRRSRAAMTDRTDRFWLSQTGASDGIGLRERGSDYIHSHLRTDRLEGHRARRLELGLPADQPGVTWWAPTRRPRSARCAARRGG